MKKIGGLLFFVIAFCSFCFVVKADIEKTISFDASMTGVLQTNGEYKCPASDDTDLDDTGNFKFTLNGAGNYNISFVGNANSEKVTGSATCNKIGSLTNNDRIIVKLEYAISEMSIFIGNIPLTTRGGSQTSIAEKTIITNTYGSEVADKAVVNERNIADSTAVIFDQGYYVAKTDEEKNVQAGITFTSGEVKYSITWMFVLNLGFKIEAYPGNYGKCDFNSTDWKSSGSAYSAKNTTVTLPNCTSTTPGIEFVGWSMRHALDNQGSNLQELNICEQFATYKPGNSVSADDGKMAFYACYKGKSGVTLVYFDSYESLYGISKSQYGSCTDSMNGNCFIETSSSIALPQLQTNDKYEFKGWSENGCGSSSVLVLTGLVGKTYCPTFEKKGVKIEEETITYKVDPSKKFMYEGATEYYSVSGVTFTGCSSSDGSVTTSIKDGMCVLASTPGTANKTINITARGDDGKDYKLNLTIVEKKGTTYTGGSSASTTYTIKYDGYVTVKGGTGAKTDTTDSGNYGKSKIRKSKSDGDGKATPYDFEFCDDYTVSWISEDPDERFVHLLNGNYGATLFYATPNCKNAPSAKYNAICIDAGGDAPRGTQFKLDGTYNGTQNPSMDVYSKVMWYAAYKMDKSGNPSKAMRGGYTGALRIITILLGKDMGCAKNSSGYDACLAFQGYAKTIRNGGTLTAGNGANTEALSHMNELLKAFNALKGSDSYNGVTIPDGEYVLDVKEDGLKFDFTQKDDKYEGTFEVDLDLPLGGDVSDGEFGLDNPNYEKKGKFDVTTVNLSGSKLTVKVSYTKDDISDLSKEDAIKIKFKAKGLLATAILIPAVSGSYQRVYIYEKSDKEFELGLSIEMDEEENKCEDGDENCEENCEKLLTSADKKELNEEEEAYFAKTCCQFITNEKTSSAFQHYCMDKNKKVTDCSLTTYALVCDTASSENVETYKVYEAVKGTADSYGTCVIDVRRVDRNENGNQEPLKTTRELADVKGNNYSIDAFNGNQYCAVTCSERWDFDFAGFKHFVGTNAVAAGSYFQMSNDLYIKQERTCVTTNIDYRKYYNEVYELSNKLIATYNAYLEYTAAYDSAKENFDHYDDEENSGENPIKVKYCTKLETYECECSGGYTGTCTRCAQSEDEMPECPIYRLHVHDDSVSGKTAPMVDLLGANPMTGSGGNIAQSSSKDDVLYEASNKSGVRSASGPSCGSGSTVEAWCESTDDWAGLSQEEIFKIMVKRTNYVSQSEEHTTSGGYKYDFTEGAKNPEPYTKWGGGAITGTIDAIKREMTSLEAKIQEKAQDMSQCQNFYMSNDAPANYKNKYSQIDSIFYNYGSTDQAVTDPYDWPIYQYRKTEAAAGYYSYWSFDSPNDFWNSRVDKNNLRISSNYFPGGAYEYDEYEYMTMINDKNYLITNNEKNAEISGKEADGNGIFNYKDNTTSGNTDSNDDGKSDREGTKIWINKLDTYAYDADSSPWTNDGNGKAYKGGTTLKTNNENGTKFGLDRDSELQTVKGYMNICRVKMKGKEPYGWDNTDTEETVCIPMEFYYYKASYIKQTLTNSSYYMNYGNFYTLNHTSLEVFAKDKAEAMKIGGVGSAIDWSARAPYNVFPIEHTTRRGLYKYMYAFKDVGNFNTASADLGRVMGSDKSIVDYSAHVCFYEVFEDLCLCCGYPIDTMVYNSLVNSPDYTQFGFTSGDYLNVKGSKETYKSTFNKNSEGGVLNLHPSVVSLYELNDMINSNWNPSTKFLYDGEMYQTSNDKSAQLAESIKKIGENVYSEVPEYSYTLTHEALQEIKESNAQSGYQMTFDKLHAVGSFTYFNNKYNGVGDGTDDEPGFAHYASQFLEGTMSNYINEDAYKDGGTIFTERSNICVAKGDISKVDGSDCRWIDYVGPISGGSKISEYRMAFK